MTKKETRQEFAMRFENYYSQTEMANADGVSRQAIFQRIKKFGLEKEAKNLFQQAKILNLPKISCVYCLYFQQTPHLKYYGSTKNLRLRAICHKSTLSLAPRNVNPSLAKDYRKYGLKSLVFEIVEEVPQERLLDKERCYIEKNTNVYNIFSPVVYQKEKKTKIKEYGKRYYEKAKATPNRKSKYQYVAWWKPTRVWRVQVKGHYVGYYKDEEKAHEAATQYLKNILPKLDSVNK